VNVYRIQMREGKGRPSGSRTTSLRPASSPPRAVPQYIGLGGGDLKREVECSRFNHTELKQFDWWGRNEGWLLLTLKKFFTALDWVTGGKEDMGG